MFSCYKFPDLAYPPPRKLIIEPKDGGGIFEIPLAHNKIVCWSLETNRLFRHKIVLDRASNPRDNEWLGITFRTSNTFVRFQGERGPYFEEGTPLTLANESQKKEFYKLRGEENRKSNFKYPALTYTVSTQDTLPPTL